MPLFSYWLHLQRNASSAVLPMKPEHQQVFDNSPEPDPRSKLDPYVELILRWRRQGKTYRWIMKLLRDSFSLSVSYCALYKFIKKRSRPRKLKPETDLEMERTTAAPTPAFAPAPLPGKLTPEERERQRAILKALREKSVVTTKEDDDFPLWDPNKPLTNKPTS